MPRFDPTVWSGPTLVVRKIVVRRAGLFSEKIPQARHLNDVVGRQNRANQIRLRRGVNFIQVTLIFGPHHKFPDARVESVFRDYVGTRAERAADALFVD
jgi:hypothetical protein